MGNESFFINTMVTKIKKNASEAPERPRRGRPPGRTAQGDATRSRLYEVAVASMAREGYEATTLRGIAAEAGVSHVALYRYFPGKHAIVLALYENLSAELVAGAEMPRGRWAVRVAAATRASIQALAPHRETLREVIPILVSRGEKGIFSPETGFSRERVSGLFVDAVTGATDAPALALAEAVGRLSYLVHLGMILFWLLDVSPGQRASDGCLALLTRVLRITARGLRLPGGPALLRRADALASDGLMPRSSAG